MSSQAAGDGEVLRSDDGPVRMLKINRPDRRHAAVHDPDATRIIKSLMRASERDAIAAARRREDDAYARLLGR